MNSGMISGIINIIFGLIMAIGGLTGKLALRGTDSGGALAALGLALIAWGAFKLWRQHRATQPQPDLAPDQDKLRP